VDAGPKAPLQLGRDQWVSGASTVLLLYFKDSTFPALIRSSDLGNKPTSGELCSVALIDLGRTRLFGLAGATDWFRQLIV
jgi:hypothetical protein